MKRNLQIGIVAVALALTSCSTSDNSTPEGTTPVTLKMTDAPAYYDAIVLNIDEIEILTTSGRETIDVDEHPFDILKFRNGRDTVIAEHDVPSGMIQEIRLKLHDEGNTITVDGVTSPLTTPSGQSSGVKLKIQDELIPNIGYTLLLDFDASKSIHQTGNGKYMLKPVIRAIPVEVTGAIKGMIQPIEAFPHIYAISETDTLGTLADETGAFYFPGVLQGEYKVIIEPSSMDFPTDTIYDVNVSNGMVNDLGTTVLE
ncbi:DUF4382 domain-containing protein [Sphingobacterium shayense]|uniref:DUF4382 domain-containing protein n=1 Tax=Sphingobacterium shayense TaxID=626343 RepID=UPI001557DE9E|nr:DUF4382 domain-containing protein [Sphingobacterium shayense]NQD71504.1 DUF4382 domain-containing protein [Sphingobacterium shayense]